MNRRRYRRISGVIVLLAMMLAGVGTTIAEDQVIQRASSQYFRIQSEVGKNRRGAAIVSGYLYNDYGYTADNIQFLIEGLDAAGQVVSKDFVRYMGAVAPFSRSSFDYKVSGAAANYRVSVYWYDWSARGGG